MLALAFVALIPRFVLGLLIIGLIWKAEDLESRTIQIFLAGPVGIGISSLLSFLWIWAGLDLRVYAIGEAIAAAVALAIAVWNRKSSIFEPVKILWRFITPQAIGWPIVLALGMALLIGEFWLNSIQYPHGLWDAWANWNVVARFVYRGGQEWTGTFLRIFDHPDYPFLLAMANATTWELLPKETDRGPAALAFLFTICLAGLLYGLTLKLRDPRQASLAAVVLITQPILAFWGMSQYADLPEAYYFLACAGLMLIYLRNEERPVAILGGLTAGLAAWTKNEGLPLVLISLIAWVWISRLRDKTAVINFLFGLAFPLLVVILFKIYLAPANDLVSGSRTIMKYLQDGQRYVTILREAGIYFWNIGGSVISIVLLLIAYAAFAGKTGNPVRGLPLLIFIVTSQLLVYFFIYVTTPDDLQWQISTSMSRLYLHVFPMMALGLFLWLKSPNELAQKV